MDRHPITAGPEAPAEAHPRACRYGGAPWLSYVDPAHATRPLGPDRRPLVLILQLALDALPRPPALPGLLVQVFAEAPVRGYGCGTPGVRVLDLDAERGALASVERPEDARCRPMSFGPAQPDRPPLQRDKLFGLPIRITEGDDDLGACPECRRPRELLLHVEGKLNVPYSFGDAGWLILAWCPEHPWGVIARSLQVP